jgi:hypothetical protein
MPGAHNEQARLVGREAGMAPVGGSDAHSLAHVARAFTTVPGARTKEEFLAGLRTGLTVPSGRSGSYARLTSEVVRIFAAGYVETARELSRGRLAPACRGEPSPSRRLPSSRSSRSVCTCTRGASAPATSACSRAPAGRPCLGAAVGCPHRPLGEAA